MPSRSGKKTTQIHQSNNLFDPVKSANKRQCLHHRHHPPKSTYCFEGDRLSCLFHAFHREIESERYFSKILPEKLWFKQQFAVGVNEVTRLLERMPSSSGPTFATSGEQETLPLLNHGEGYTICASSTKLQAVLLASECNPRWLTKHIPNLASSRNVPLIHVEDRKGGSMRLGQLVKIKTALAVGVKAKGSGINQFVQRRLHDGELEGTGA